MEDDEETLLLQVEQLHEELSEKLEEAEKEDGKQVRVLETPNSRPIRVYYKLCLVALPNALLPPRRSRPSLRQSEKTLLTQVRSIALSAS